MADNTLKNDVDATIHDTDTEPATKHDVGIGGAMGAVGGAIVGALAGGPVGAVIGAIAGGAASAGAVDVVDKHDHDYARTAHDGDAATIGTGAYAADTTTTRGTEYTGPGDYQRTQAVDAYDTTATPASAFAADTTTTPRTGIDGDQKVELYEEELHANKERVQAGEVTLHKEVITETKSIDVPVTREEVVIERHAVTGGQVAGNVNLGADEVIRVPVMEEQVNVQKTAVVTGEVEIGKRQVTETQHVEGTVRHEEVRVENTGGVDVVERGDRA